MPIQLPQSPRRKPLPPLPIFTPSSELPSSDTSHDTDVVFLGHVAAFMFLVLSSLESVIVAFSSSSSIPAVRLCGLNLSFNVPISLWLCCLLLCPSRFVKVKAFLNAWTVVCAGMSLAVGGVMIMRVGEGLLVGTEARRAVIVGGFSVVASIILLAVTAERLYRIDMALDGGLYSPLASRDEEDLLLDLEKIPEAPETPELPITPVNLGPFFALGVYHPINAPLIRCL